MSALKGILLSGGCASAICVLGFLNSPAARAQSAAATTAAPPTAAPAEPANDLEEIVVTARKVKENLITTPVSITALTASQMEEKGIIDVMSLSEFSPGFTDQNQQVNRNDRSFTSYIIRGVAEAGGTAGEIRPAVTTFLDGSPMGFGEIPEI
jgi:iron complex outermembrane receptor protein